MLPVSPAWRRMENIQFVNTESNESNVESHAANTSKITFIYALIWLHYCSNKICVCMKRFVCLCLCLCVMEDFYMWHAICVCANRPLCQYLKLCVCHRIMCFYSCTVKISKCVFRFTWVLWEYMRLWAWDTAKSSCTAGFVEVLCLSPLALF